MKKDRFLLYIFYALGLLCVGVFIVTKNEYMMAKATETMYDDGDLYRFAKVRHFKVPMPENEFPDDDTTPANLDSVRVFMIGDSFLESCQGHQALPIQLSEALDEKVYAVQAGDSIQYFNPMYFFKKEGITNSRPRVLILERVERYIIDEFIDPFDEDPAPAPQVVEAESEWKKFERRWFTDAEKNYEILLTSSSVTAPLIELWNTACFSVLGRMSEKIPAYSLNPPFLFYDEEVMQGKTTSYYYPHTDSLIAQIADNLAAISSTLKERYNTDLLFMPVPNAYTLYHTFINNDPYDGFVPRLESALEKRGVKVVKLYQKYVDADNILYFPTDSHWNARGVAIALEETMSQLRQMR
jgi:hypothetical protein